MKKTVLLIILAMYSVTYAQSYRDRSLPISFEYSSTYSSLKSQSSLPVFNMPSINTDSLLALEDENKKGRYGFSINKEINVIESGVWDTLDNGSEQICRLRVISKGANSLNFNFNKFRLSEGSKLWIYNPNGNWKLGPYTFQNNLQHEKLSTFIIKGDSAIIEYFQPVNNKDKDKLVLNNIIHGYRNLNGLAGGNVKNNKNEKMLTNLEDVSEDVSCPMGDPWCLEKRSVTYILYSFGHGAYGCTGVLVNDYSATSTPYILSNLVAFDANIDNEISEYEKLYGDSYNFTFGYYELECEKTPSTLNQIIEYPGGCEFKAANYNSQISILKLNDQINTDDDIYFAGWEYSASELAPTQVTIFHHPWGWPMQISLHNTNFNVYSDYDNDYPEFGNNFWITQCLASCCFFGDESMGGPCFNQNHHVIALNQFHECCADKPSDAGWIKQGGGKFSVAWNPNGNNDEQLKYWLAPNSTGSISVDGRYNLSEHDMYLNGIVHDPGFGTLPKYPPGNLPPNGCQQAYFSEDEGMSNDEDIYYFNIGKIFIGTKKRDNYLVPFQVKYYPDYGTIAMGRVTVVSTKEIIIKPCTRILIQDKYDLPDNDHDGYHYYFTDNPPMPHEEFIARIGCSATDIRTDLFNPAGVYIPNTTNFYPSCCYAPQNIIPKKALSNHISDNFNFISCSPNPFSEETKIEFSNDEKGYLKLELVNMLGEQVGVLIDNNNHPKGNKFSYTLISSNLSSGVYYLTLKTSKSLLTLKLIIAK